MNPELIDELNKRLKMEENNLTTNKLEILDNIHAAVKKHLDIKTEKDFHKFHDWVEIVFGCPALCGLDNIDVYNALKDTEIKLDKITGKTIEEIKEKISLDYDLHCCIMGVELPQGMGHEDVTSIGVEVVEKLNDNANVIWQGINKDVDEITVYLMMGKK